jgi:NADH:ubiquinone oxidoreductase subunit 6 (subunit J)
VPLIGALPQPITSAPLVLFIYLVLILMLGSALASVLVRNALYAIGAFAASMVLVALLYLMIAPFLLFAVQLLVFTIVSAALLIGLLQKTTGLRPSTLGPFSREWVIGAAVSAAVLALFVVVLATTSWPVGLTGNAGPGIGETLTNKYVVGLGVLVVIVASAALGSGILLAAPTAASPRGGGTLRGREPRR